MAIPITDPYRRVQPDVMGAIRVGLDAQLARERMMVEQAAAERRAQQEERNRERQHQQMMAQYGLQEMKFNYDMAQDQPGGLKYAQTMAQIGQMDAATAENQAQAGYWQKRTENPSAFMSPGAAARPRIVPLTSKQMEANANAAAMGLPAPYQPQVIMPPTSSAGPAAYDGSADLPTNYGAADPLIASPPPDGTYDDSGDPSLFPAAMQPAPIQPADNTPGENPPNYSAPVPVSVATAAGGPLPMDPANVQRRQAMEYARIKEQAEVSAALNKQKQDAINILDPDRTGELKDDPIAKAQLEQANRELAKIYAPAPKAEVVPEDSVTTTVDNSMANQPAGRAVVNPATGFMTAADQQQEQQPPAPQTVMELADVYRKGTASVESPANQQWTAAKQSLLQTIGGREGLARELAAMNPPENLAQMKARIRSILEKRRNPTDDLRGMGFFPDQNNIDIGPLPPDADVDDVADGLAEDLWREPGASAPAKKQGVTITRIK